MRAANSAPFGCQKYIESVSRLLFDQRYGSFCTGDLRIESMGNPAGSNRWGLPHLGLVISSARFPLQLTVSIVDRSQELREAGCFRDRPQSLESRTKNTDVTGSEQADCDYSLIRHIA